jgi:hypothetical protein
MTVKLSTLLQNTDYRSYFQRNVKYPTNVYHQAPWRVWVHLTSGKWGQKTFATYGEAFKYTVPVLKKAAVQDVSISSRLIGFRPPEQIRLHYQTLGYDWCLMCRRPVQFVTWRKHHALRNDLHQFFAHHPVCPYCGIREETMRGNGVTIGKN